MAQEQDSKTAPFGPWTTFKSFIGTDLKGRVVPPKVDSSLFRGRSGTDGRQLRSALRFFGLVTGSDDDVTQALRDLVESHGTETWGEHVKRLLPHYDAILAGVDMEAGTQGSLEAAFRDNGNVSGSTLRKAVRFYLTAAKEAGKKLSPHFVSLRSGSENGENKPAATSTAPKVRRTRRAVSYAEEKQPMAPEGVEEIPLLPGTEFRVWIPRNITDAQLEFGLKYLKGYLKLTRPNTQKNKTELVEEE